MITLNDILNADELAQALLLGHVKVQQHPSQPFAILNYTAQCQWELAWNETTRACRGLIYNTQTNEVVARPWPKFFNYGEIYGEEGAVQLELERPCRVFDKMDGSLGIVYVDHDLPMVATRGSFTSEQANAANRILADKYPDWRPESGLTYLFEIIYPGNRIVVDYKGMEDLVLLDILETDTGKQAQDFYWGDWYGPWVDELEAETLREALELEPRPNAEGIVVRFEDNGDMLKIKQEDYVALHRIVTGLNERTVWEHLREGGTIEDLAKTLPEEFQPWVLGVGGNLMGEFLRIKAVAQGEYENVVIMMEEEMKGQGNRDWTRKDFAQYVTKEYTNEMYPLLFMLLDGKDIDEPVWKQLRPVAPKQLMNVSEDVA